MTKFVGILFPDEVKVDEASQVLRDLDAEGEVLLSGIAVVVKDATGKLSVNQLADSRRTDTVGAALGALAGLVAGGLGLAVLAAAGGALVGKAADVCDLGDRKRFLDEVSGQITPGGAAVLAEITELSESSLYTRMAAIGGTVIRE
jgi:uncharacterized membrane protein